jgi:hypothetical protein
VIAAASSNRWIRAVFAGAWMMLSGGMAIAFLAARRLSAARRIDVRAWRTARESSTVA